MSPRLVRIALLVVIAACGGSSQQQPGKVVVHEAPDIEILDPITFAGETELTPGSYKTLDSVAQTFVGNPEIQLVEVGVFVLEGDEATRQQIADRRAKLIVDYLIGKQVAAERLEAAGYVTPAEGHRTSGVRFLILKRAPTE